MVYCLLRGADGTEKLKTIFSVYFIITVLICICYFQTDVFLLCLVSDNFTGESKNYSYRPNQGTKLFK